MRRLIVFGVAGIVAMAAGPACAGSFSALAGCGDVFDEQTSIVYDPGTGGLGVEAPASTNLTSINIDSAGGIFTGDPAQNLGGPFDNDADNNIFKATFGDSFRSISFGAVAQAGLSKDWINNDLTVVGSLEGGGGLGDVDMHPVYCFPEPSSLILALLGIVGLLHWRRLRTCTL